MDMLPFFSEKRFLARIKPRVIFPLMADGKDEEVPKMNEWEVLTLTDSAYAAAPGPMQGSVDDSHGNLFVTDDTETSRAMFMSGHFSFPPSGADTPQKFDYKEISGGEDDGIDKYCEGMVIEEGKMGSKNKELLSSQCLTPDDEILSSPKLDDKGNEFFWYSSNYTDEAFLNVSEKEQSLDDIANFEPHDTETIARQETSTESTEPSGSQSGAVNPTLSNLEKHAEENKHSDEPLNHSSEAWWRRHAASAYDHAKNANPFWSIFVAVSVVGLVILGHRWHRDKQQVLHLKSPLVTSHEETSWIVGPVSKFKAVALSDQHGPYIRFVPRDVFIHKWFLKGYQL